MYNEDIILGKLRKNREQLENIVQQTDALEINKADKTQVNTLTTEKATKVEVEVERQRINSFTTLATGSTTGDAELIDLRVGADGITDTSAGFGVRRQLNRINEILVNGSVPVNTTDMTASTEDGKFYSATTGVSTSSASVYTGHSTVEGGKSYQVTVFSLQDGWTDNKLTFWNNGTLIPYNNYTNYVVIDSNKKIIKVVAPSNATEIRYTNLLANKSNGFCHAYFDYASVNYPWISVNMNNLDTETKNELVSKTSEITLVPNGVAYIASPSLIITSNSNYAICEPVPVAKGEVYSFTANTTGGAIVKCDSAGNIISKIVDGIKGTLEINVDFDGYIRFYYYSNTSNTATYVQPHLYRTINFGDTYNNIIKNKNDIKDIQTERNLPKKLYSHSVNKPLNFGSSLVSFGDSINVGVCSDGGTLTTQPTNSYINKFAEHIGVTHTNYGASGTYICDTSNGSIYSKVMAYSGTAGTIVISGGCNDWNYGKTLGVLGDTGTSTFYGCLYNMCEHLKTSCPNATVIFITPINQSKSATGGAIYGNSNPYRNAIYEMASIYGFNIVDGSLMGFPTEAGAYCNEMIYDKIHPTIKGHAMYARNLAGVLC